MNSLPLPLPAPQLHFARGFRFVGHLVVIVFRILFVDIVKWACVYLIIVPGFGVTLFLLVRDEWVRGRGMGALFSSRVPFSFSLHINFFLQPLRSGRASRRTQTVGGAEAGIGPVAGPHALDQYIHSHIARPFSPSPIPVSFSFPPGPLFPR